MLLECEQLRLVRPEGLEPSTPCLEVARKLASSLNFEGLGSAELSRISHFHRISAPQAHPVFAVTLAEMSPVKLS